MSGLLLVIFSQVVTPAPGVSVADEGSLQGFAIRLDCTGSGVACSVSSATATVNLLEASGSQAGVVTTGTQTFAGNKTFTGYIVVDQIGVGTGGAPGQDVHVANGNLLIDGASENAYIMKRTGVVGARTDPIFQIGRIVAGGVNEPVFRWMYSDSVQSERQVLDIEGTGTVANILDTTRRSMFEGYLAAGHVNPCFRLNAYPDMRLELGPCGASDTDVVLTRNGSGRLDLNISGTTEATLTSSGLTLSDALGVASGGTNLTAAADDAVMVGNATTWQSKTLPSCSGATTDKLLYNSSTNAFSCGVDQGGAGGYATIQEEGTGLTQRATLNFIGSSITCVDDGSSKTNCTVTGGSGTSPLVLSFGGF